MMAAKLLCKRLVSRPNLYRSLCQSTKSGDPWHHVSNRIDRDNQMMTTCSHGLYGWRRDPWVPEYDLEWDANLPILFMESGWVEDEEGYDFEGDTNGPALINESGWAESEEEDEEDEGEKRIERILGIGNFCQRSVVDPRIVWMIVEDIYPPTIFDCHCSLKDFLRDRESRLIFRPFLALMLVHGTIPRLSTFSILIKSYCKYLTYQHVLDLVFTQMKAVGVEADAYFYKRLIHGVCAHFKFYYSYQLLKRLISHRIQVPLSCYDAVVRQLCPTKMIDDISQISALVHVLVKMKQELVYPDEKIHNCLLKVFHVGFDGVNDMGYFNFLKCVSLGTLMFAEGIRVGAVSPSTALRTLAQRSSKQSPRMNWKL